MPNLFRKVIHSMFANPCGAHAFVPADEQASRTGLVAPLPRGSNTPHDMNREQLRAFLDGAQDDLAKCDEKMEVLLKDVNALHEERDKIQCHIWDARNLLHPIQTLNDDVLLEIFAHCLLDREAFEWMFCTRPDSEYSSLNSRNVPWTLSQVCSGWRRVALSAPRLWSTIIFTSPALPAKKMAGSSKSSKLPRFCYNLGLFMSRSGNCDISLGIRIPRDETMSHIIFVQLAVSATRWRRLYFRADRSGFPAALSGLHLERLEEIVLLDISERMDGKLLPPFQAAPRLKRMYISEVLSVILPWSQITHFESKIFINEWSLREMPHLTHLLLRVCDPRAPVDHLPSKLSFPKLVSLSFDPCTCTFLSAFLPRLDIPALTDFRLTLSSSDMKSQNRRSSSATSLQATMDKLVTQLTSLHIACRDPGFIDVAVLASVLQLTTDLTALSIHLPSIPDALLDSLRVRTKSELLVPRLRSLDLRATDKDKEMSALKLLYVLESRSGVRRDVSRLEEFCTNVDAGRFSEEGRLQRWQNLCRKVNVFCPR